MSVTVGDIIYALSGSNATVSGVNGSPTTITIPDTITVNATVYNVTSIGNSAFRNKSSLTSVTLPTNNLFTIIGASAFDGCTKLVSITIPNSVLTIGNAAFWGCTSLESVTFQEISKVTSIGNNAFEVCSKLSSITIPNSVTSIGQSAFQNCSKLPSITIPNSVTTIGVSAFRSCTLLTSVTFQEISKVTSIGNDTFRTCTSLTSITIPNSVTSIGISAFLSCSALTSVTFMGDIPTIASGNFTSNTNDTAYYYSGAQNISRLSPTPQIFTNIVEISADLVPGAPTINTVTVSSGQASIDFTAGENSGSSITNYEYNINGGSTWVARNPVNTASPIIVTGLTNKTNYTFQIRAVNAMGAGAGSSVFNKKVRPTLPEAKVQNAVKADYMSYDYILQNLINSTLYTLYELKQIGYTLNDLKVFFTPEALINSNLFNGAELKQEGIISSGITFFIIVIVLNGNVSFNRTYALNNMNNEETQYIVYFDDQYLQTQLSNIPI